jgi:hypothetical protein
MISALSRWWGYYSAGLGIIESKVVRAFWKFAHRKECNASFLPLNNWEVVRKELICADVSPTTDKIRLILQHQFQLCPSPYSAVQMWSVSEWDYRMKCRKCGRIHQRTLTHYQPL